MKINGSLVFDASAASVIENLRVQRFESAVARGEAQAADVGRLVYLTDTDVLQVGREVSTGVYAWVNIATGGDAQALQTEVDAIETSLGAGINADGSFSATGFATGGAFDTAPTSFTDAINKLATYADGNNELSELNDVTLTNATANDLLQYSGTAWVNKAIGAASGVQAHDAGLDSIAAVNPTGADQMLYTTGPDQYAATPLTSFGRSLLDDADATAGRETLGVVIGTDVQAWDQELAALASVTAAADKLPYFTGSSTADVTTLTSFARELLDDADATAARATLNAQAADGTLSAIADLTGGIVVVDTTGGSAYARTLVAPSEGFTITNPNGVSGDPTFVLANDLNALESLTGAGIIVRTADNAAAVRSMVAPAAGITITNADGVSGNITLALANDLGALEGQTGTGYLIRTGDGTATTRSITGTAERIVVSNGDGVASDTSVDLATVAQASGGSFLKVTIDSYGRVSANTAVVQSDITALVDAVYVDVAGDTMTGNLTMATGSHVSIPSAPTDATHATNKAYVDALVVGLTWEAPVDRIVATLPGTPANATERVYVSADNKIYTATSANTWDAGETVVNGAAFFNKGDDTGYTFNGDALVAFTGTAAYTWGVGLSVTGNTVNVNLGAGIAQLPTDEVGIDVYAPTGGALILTTDGSTASEDTGAKLHLKLNGAGGLAQDGDGLRINANSVTNDMLVNDTFTANADTGTDTVSLGDTIEVRGTSTQGIDTAVVGTTGATTFTVTAKDASSSQKGVASFDANQFSVSAGNVTLGTVPIANLASNDITFAATVGSAGEIDLGGTLTIAGTGAISTTATTGSVFINVATSTTAGTVGVAAFDGGDFDIVNGVVSVKALGIDNNQLVNDSVLLAGSTGTGEVDLGATLTVNGSGAISTNATGGTITVSVATATDSVLGVASFDNAHFSVSAGAVSLAATLDDLTNVAGADSAATGSVLVKGATEWTATGAADFAGTVKLGDLQDVGAAVPSVTGNMLVADGANWVSKKVYHLHTQPASATGWTVTHNLDQKYCNVTVVDGADEVIIPQSVTFTNNNSLVVTFNTAITGYVIVMGVTA